MSIQLDLFNNVTPIATFDWASERNLKIFDYSDDLQFDDAVLEGHYVINVPCYKIEDLIGLVSPDDRTSKYASYWKLTKNKELNHCIVRITDRARGGGCGDKLFVLANAQTKKWVEQNSVFAMIKGDIKKLPRLYKKVIKISDISYRDDMDTNFVQGWTQSKWQNEYVLSQLEE